MSVCGRTHDGMYVHVSVFIRVYVCVLTCVSVYV